MNVTAFVQNLYTHFYMQKHIHTLILPHSIANTYVEVYPWTHICRLKQQWELSSNRQEILKVSKLFLFLFFSVHSVRVHAWVILGSSIWSHSDHRCSSISCISHLTFWLVSDGNMFKHPVCFSYISSNHEQSLGMCLWITNTSVP